MLLFQSQTHAKILIFSSLFLQRFRHIRKLDSQHRFLQKALFMTTSSRVFFKDPAFFYVICSAEKPMG